MTEELVIVVDENDQVQGEMEKLAAHEQGVLHRAFSVLIYNTRGEMLLQRRAAGKYHSPLLWSNACCSHPRPGEEMKDAVQRRLREEIGLSCPARFSHWFHYKIDFENGLTEHEIDHVFVGITDETPSLNPDEVDSFRYVDVAALQTDMQAHPDNYTFWFHLIMKDLRHD
jgi:isopentenyl-diphosphate delta-isomerase